MYKNLDDVLKAFNEKGYVLPEDFSNDYPFNKFVEEYQDYLAKQ